MQFIDLVEKRQSDRKYIQKEISDSDLYKIIEAARLAPSAYYHRQKIRKSIDKILRFNSY